MQIPSSEMSGFGIAPQLIGRRSSASPDNRPPLMERIDVATGAFVPGCGSAFCIRRAGTWDPFGLPGREFVDGGRSALPFRRHGRGGELQRGPIWRDPGYGGSRDPRPPATPVQSITPATTWLSGRLQSGYTTTDMMTHPRHRRRAIAAGAMATAKATLRVLAMGARKPTGPGLLQRLRPPDLLSERLDGPERTMSALPRPLTGRERHLASSTMLKARVRICLCLAPICSAAVHERSVRLHERATTTNGRTENSDVATCAAVVRRSALCHRRAGAWRPRRLPRG